MTLRATLFFLLGLFVMAGCPTTGGGDDDDSGGSADDDDAAASCADEDDVGNHSEADAEVVPATGDTWTDMYVCPDVDDFYAYTATVDGFLSVDATFTHDTGDVDIHMHSDDSGNFANGASNNDNEMMRQFITAGTTVYVTVEAEFADDDTPGNTYDITIGWKDDV